MWYNFYVELLMQSDTFLEYFNEYLSNIVKHLCVFNAHLAPPSPNHWGIHRENCSD